MICAEARALFSALVDEALARSERDGLDAHVSGCAECRRELKRFQQTLAALRGVRPVRAPVGFVDRVLEAAHPTPWHRRLVARVFRPLRVKLPLEVAAMAVLGIGAVYIFQHTPELEQAARQEAPPEPADGRGRDAIVGPAQIEPKAEPPAARSPEAPRSPAPTPPPRQPERVDRERRSESAETGPTIERFREGRGVESKEEAPAPAAAAPPVVGPRAARKSAPAEESQAGALRDRGLEGAAPSSRQELAAKPLAPPPADVAGRLAVDDPDAAQRALAALIAEVGGREVSRRAEPGVTFVEVLLGGERYAEFSRGLARIGSWTAEREPAEPSGPLRLSIRVTR